MKLTEFGNAWAVYGIFQSDKASWIGATRLCELSRLPDARRAGVLQTAEDDATVRILSLELEPAGTVGLCRTILEPTVTDAPASAGQRTRAVECVETGERFKSANQAAKSHNITQSQLSVHLKTGRGTVKGYRYRYV